MFYLCPFKVCIVKGFKISDFILSWDGFLHDEDGNDARVMHEAGGDAKRGEYYWNVNHFRHLIIKALKIFQNEFTLHTDRRSSLVRPENALNAFKMNVKPGLHLFILHIF